MSETRQGMMYKIKTLCVCALLAISMPIFVNAQCSHLNFAWGASFAGSVDMSGHDMSNVGMEAYAGLKTVGVQILGVGTGLYIPVSSSQRTIPVYGIVRTNFSPDPTLCFLEVRGGLSINYLENEKTQSDGYFSTGIGMNLATGKKFSTHLILGYTLIGRRDYILDDVLVESPDLHMATIRLGVTF